MKKLASYIFFIVSCGLALSEPKIERKCLREKVIMFPEVSTQSHARLYPNVSMDFSGATVCLRFYTDLQSPNACLFSLVTPPNNQDFAILWTRDMRYKLYIHHHPTEFIGLPLNINQWNSVCATWDANTGLAQMFVNDVCSIKRKVGLLGPLKGEPSITLGQYQTSYGSVGLRPDLAFTGFISDVHMYDHVLTPRLIKNFMEAKIKFKLGNYIGWHNLKHSLTGSAQVTEKNQVTFYFKEEI